MLPNKKRMKIEVRKYDNSLLKKTSNFTMSITECIYTIRQYILLIIVCR